ncbi:bifunctional adenosylcobinamide kinase/adenosylcobinamide-phosphate guanylyltransferase, partial [Porphyromonas sp.]
FFDMQQDVDQALEALKKEFDTLVQQDATFIFVTNELGMGGMSESRTQRLFTQLQGWMNQHVAARADRVTLMVSGLPLTVKG